MNRSLSPYMYSADPTVGHTATQPAFKATTASELGFKEDWLRDAIAANPDIVIGPCREAELTDEAWIFWATEFYVEPAGKIDLLLLSESGRIGIVETKLSYNPESRRSVVAQTLEYAIHLPASNHDTLPPIPSVNGRPFADPEAVRSHLGEGDYLLLVVGDRLDPRAVKLSNSLLGRHLVTPWDLALVEIAIFRSCTDSEPRGCLMVPHLCGTLVHEIRQVVKIDIEGDRTRVEVEPKTPAAIGAPRSKQSEEQFFAAVPTDLKALADGLRQLRERYSSVTFTFGSSSLIFRHRGANMLEFYSDGYVRFRTDFFPQALGQITAKEYEDDLAKLFPQAMQQSYPRAKIDARNAQSMLTLVEKVISK